MKKVFFDASVIFSALYSQKGGSFRLVSLAKDKKLIAITSQTVIQELKDNLHKFKMNVDLIDHFIAENKFFVREEITEKEIQPFKNIVEGKDAHVVAGAILTGSLYLITLDKKHLNNPQAKKNIKHLNIFSPKEMLKTIRKRENCF